MKSIIICFGVILVLIFSCKKEQASSTQQRLVQIKDSVQVSRLEYNSNGQVSTLWIDSTGWWQHYTAEANPLHVAFTYSGNLLRANEYDASGLLEAYIDYTMNSFDLPVSIMVYEKTGGAFTNVKSTSFYYKTNSSILDSIITTGWYSFKYIPQYSGGNVVQYSKTSPWGTQVIQCSYTTSPNPWRAADPLLFIYTDPGFAENYITWLPAFFSANTIQSVTAYGVTTNISKTVSTDNRIQYEDWGIHIPFKRAYIYQ